MPEELGSSEQILREEAEHTIFSIPLDWQVIPEDEWMGPVVKALGSVLDASGSLEQWHSQLEEIFRVLEVHAGDTESGALLKQKVLVALLRKKQGFVEGSGL